MIDTAVTIRNYKPSDQPYFESLNRAWIEKYFVMEPVDIIVLQQPDLHIIAPGGRILMAVVDQEIAGTVALKYVRDKVYEFTKMAVLEKYRGKGIGMTLAESAIDAARNLNADSIILYSNRKLVPAITLYKKIGFQEVPLDGPYKRSDIKMELLLK